MVFSSFHSMAECKNIYYQLNVEKCPENIVYDPDIVEKILSNLISNAFKFVSEGGSITVSLKFIQETNGMSGYYAELQVEDSGQGIPQSELERIFDRFYQLTSHNSKKYKGSGIGLSLVKELVDLHKGTIKVESEIAKGSLFTIKLAVSESFFSPSELDESLLARSLQYNDDKNPNDIIKNKHGVGTLEHEDLNKPLVLVIDDNKDFREYISQSLKKKYQIQESENGKLGFKKASEIIPELIISDILMPVMDGNELCKKLKTDERTSHIPIILLTAKAGIESRLEGLGTGADVYMIKPFAADELLIRVKNLIGQRKHLREKFSKEFFVNGINPKMTITDKQFLQKAIEILDIHLSEADFNVETFCKELCISQKQLYRKLKAITNETPSQFIRKHRLKRSLTMLESNHDNISHIAYLVGFNDPSYYTKCFRELFGVSPGDYAKKNSHQNF